MVRVRWLSISGSIGFANTSATIQPKKLMTAKNSSHSVALMPSPRRAITVALVGFCAFLNLYAPQPLLPLFTQVFHASKVEASLTVSATTTAVALSAPWAGASADMLGRKRLIVPALLMLSLFTGMASSVSGLHGIIIWRFMQGLMMAVVFAVSIAYVSEEFAGAGVGAVMAIYVAGNLVGGFSGRFLSGLVADTFGWRWVFIVLSGLTLLGGLVSWVWLPPSRNFTDKRNFSASMRAMGFHLCNPHLLAAYAVGFNILFSGVAIFNYVNFYLSAPPFNLNTVALGLIFCVYLFGAIVTPIAGRWSGRLGYRTSLLLAITSVCLGVLLTLIPSLGIVIVGLGLSATGISICQLIATSYVGTTATEARSSATGLYVSIYYIGGSFGAILPGLVWGIGQWLACILLILAVQILTAGIAIAYWKR